MSGGHIHAVLVSTEAGNVVYERFYDITTEATRAEIRDAFVQTRNHAGKKIRPEQCYVGHHKFSMLFNPPLTLKCIEALLWYSLWLETLFSTRWDRGTMTNWHVCSFNHI